MARAFRRALTTVVLASLTWVAPAFATDDVFGGRYPESELEDGILTVCFEANTPVYTYRANILTGIRYWGENVGAEQIRFAGSGACDSSFVNVRVAYNHIGAAGCLYNGPGAAIAVADPFWSDGYGRMTFDQDCPWHWGASEPPSGEFDAMSVAAHEMGHLLGIAHDTDSDEQTNMETSINFGCRRHSLSDDDADTLRSIYTDVPGTGLSFDTDVPCV